MAVKFGVECVQTRVPNLALLGEGVGKEAPIKLKQNMI